MVISINKVKKERSETDLRWAMESRVSVNAGLPISIESSPLNCIQGIKRRLGGPSPQMRAIFETGANLSLVDMYIWYIFNVYLHQAEDNLFDFALRTFSSFKRIT